jgi:type I restriction-modification system DNA methylase subunit
LQASLKKQTQKMTIYKLTSKNIKTLADLELLSNRGRQEGLFFVPDTISNIVADLANISNPNNAIVLNSNYGEISSKLSEIENLVSIDINANNIELAKYLNPKLTFINSDPLNYSLSDKFDFVVTFPPLGQRLEINGRRTSSEILYIEKALDLLNENGFAIFILSSNFLTAPIYAEQRNIILNNFGLSKIISLPQGTIRNTGIELYILVISKANVLKTDYYAFNQYFNLKKAKPTFSVSKEELIERWDLNFHNPQNQKYQEQLNENETQKIGDLVEICFGIPFNQEERKPKGTYKILSPRNILNGFLEETTSNNFIEKDNFNAREQKAILRKGDILFPRFNREKVTIYVHNLDDNKFIANQHIVILRGKNAEYVATYLNTDSGLSLFNQQIKRHARGGALPTISLQDLTNIQIPILPIADLEYASKSELEKLSYQQLLDIKDKYDLLKPKYSNLKNEKTASPHEEQLQSLQNTLQQVLSNQQEHTLKLTIIESKIDDIKTVLLNLSVDFKEIQNLPREIEDKIARLNQKLEEQISNLHFEQKQIDTYIKEIKNWFDYYDLLESKSKKYLPEAEYIFDQISKLDNPDYSPFILQYCRALENELLSKIFRAYVQSLINRNIDFEKQFAWDLEKKDSGKPNDENTFRLSKHIQKCLTKNTEEWFFELGSMEVNLRYLTGRTIEKSRLLQDLKDFVLDRFEKELLNIEYLDEIKTIIRDYRNQSAHPNLMDTENATTFHKQMKECLINLMENYKMK